MKARITIQNDFTPSIECEAENLHKLPCDALDNTTVAVVKSASAFTAIAESLKEIGGKRFLVAPKDVELKGSGFEASKTSSFQRLYYVTREALKKQTDSILNSDPDLKAELDSQISVAKSLAELTANKSMVSRFKEIDQFLTEHANFTPTKMQEYKAENMYGKIGRYYHQEVTPIFLLDGNNKIVGNIRSLKMGEQFSYLSDETIYSESKDDDKRKQFLFAYLMNMACKNLPADQNEFLIIAAQGREKMYEALGFTKFPNDHCFDVYICRGAPTDALKEAQAHLISNAKQKVHDHQVKLQRNQRITLGLFGAAAATVATQIVRHVFLRKP